jgi:hypothetical protein
MATAHVRLGQDVRVVISRVSQAGPVSSARMRVVGEAVFPGFSRGSFAPTDLGAGAVVPAAALSEPAPDTGCGPPHTCYNYFLLRFRPGTDLAATAARLTAALTASGCPIGSCHTSPDQRPGDIRGYAGIRDTPLALGAALAALAIGTLAHVLLTSVRRRARDLAMLKALGCTRSQVLRVVAWQATALAAAALLIGVPAGVVAGRWAWALFADSVGVSAQPGLSLALILAVIALTLALANLIAAWPGWRAARVRPATALRSE